MNRDKKYRLERRIGKGAFGTVFKATSRSQPGEVVAIKIVKVGTGMDRYLKREIAVMRSVKHEYIIPLLDLIIDSSEVSIIMPLQQGSVTRLGILKAAQHETILFALLYQMLSALQYLASKQLCHRDVKPDNILYTERAGKYKFQLADFGLANSQLRASTGCGTKVFMAPEIMRGSPKQTPVVDVWSLFVTVASVLGYIDVISLSSKPSDEILRAIADVADKQLKHLKDMAQVDDTKRFSAGAMIHRLEQTHPQYFVEPAGRSTTPPTLPVMQPKAETVQQVSMANISNPWPYAAPALAPPHNHFFSVQSASPPQREEPIKNGIFVDPAIFLGIIRQELVEPRPANYFDRSNGTPGRDLQWKMRPMIQARPVPPVWAPRDGRYRYTCHVGCTELAVQGQRCNCHYLCNPKCPLAYWS